MNRGIASLAGIAGLVLLTACAGYTIQKDGCGAGYDVYGSHPYLFVTQVKDDKGVETATFAVKYLPDYSRRYRISSWSGLGKADFSFELTDGWQLTKIADKSDNTKIADSISTLVGLAKGVLNKTGSGGDLSTPMVYRIEFDDCGKVAGLTKIEGMTIKDSLVEVPARPLAPCGPCVPR